MFSLSVKKRNLFRRQVQRLRENGDIPAVLYGPEIKESLSITVNQKTFSKIYKEAGETSLISLEVYPGSDEKEKAQQFSVLINDTKKDPVTGNVMHVDFYQPKLKEKIIASVHIVFEGESPAQKESGGTFIKNISEIEVKALPQDLPKEIKVDISVLKTIEDKIHVSDLFVKEGVEILKDKDELVAYVAPMVDIEEDLERPIEENVESVEKVETKKAQEPEEE